MPIFVRQLTIALLVGIFCFQTWLVYTDKKGYEAQPLSDLALKGQDLWRTNNCQSCHQIYGFGGFLGPDLTNAAYLTQERLDYVLINGLKQMPAFAHLTKEQRQAIHQYLIELDRTGVSQPQVAQGKFDPVEKIDQLANSQTLNDKQKQGQELMTKFACFSCHLPNQNSPLRAPDLTQVTQKLSSQVLDDILTNGIPEKGMPRFDLTGQEKDALKKWLFWLNQNRAHIVGDEGAMPSILALPWFEYERRDR